MQYPYQEHELLSAVARQAFADLASPRAPRERQLARAWVMSAGEAPFSFDWICARLGIDAEAARQTVCRHEGHAGQRLGA